MLHLHAAYIVMTIVIVIIMLMVFLYNDQNRCIAVYDIVACLVYVTTLNNINMLKLLFLNDPLSEPLPLPFNSRIILLVCEIIIIYNIL